MVGMDNASLKKQADSRIPQKSSLVQQEIT